MKLNRNDGFVDLGGDEPWVVTDDFCLTFREGLKSGSDADKRDFPGPLLNLAVKFFRSFMSI